MSIQERNYWLSTVDMPRTNGARSLPEKMDVVVIGAGFTGLSAALELAKKGARVAVLEGESIGWGASSRNGGMVLTGLKLGIGELIRKYGREKTQAMYAATVDSIDLVEKIVREENIDCDFSRYGHLAVACKQKHFDNFARQAEVIAREFHRELRLVPRNQLKAEIGSDIYYGGLVDEVSAGANPARYVAGLGQAALRAGACVYEGTRVEKIEHSSKNGSGGWHVSTSRGPMWARDVMVATSGYTSKTTPALHKKIIPIGSYIIVTEVLPEAVAREVSPRERMIFDSKNYLYYYRLTPDRRMLFGGRAAFFPESENSIRQSAELLRRGMIDVYPQLKDTKVEFVWGGTLDFAFDIMPHAGRMDGIYYSLGYAGHGVAMATYLGQKIAQFICTGRDENPYAAIPFPGAPLGMYNGNPWFLPLAGMYYKFLDWVG